MTITQELLQIKIARLEERLAYRKKQVEESPPHTEYGMGVRTFLAATEEELQIMRYALTGLRHEEAECCF